MVAAGHARRRAPPAAPPRSCSRSDAPRHSTGPGAIVWSSASSLPGPRGAPRIRDRTRCGPAGSRPGSRAPQPTRAHAHGLAAAAAAPHGRILLAGPRAGAASAAHQRPQRPAAQRRPAAGPFTAPRPRAARPPRWRSRPPTWATSPSPRRPAPQADTERTIELRVHRYYARSFLGARARDRKPLGRRADAGAGLPLRRARGVGA